tara:strand:+ start:1101 stop:1496 length:396 start_codon:yes stop_codon:yes gene_type:complete
MRVKLEHLLIGIIVLFGLHLLIDRCSCNLNNGFRVGGNIQQFFEDKDIKDIYDKIKNDLEGLSTRGLELAEDLIELTLVEELGDDLGKKINSMIHKLDEDEKTRLLNAIQEEWPNAGIRLGGPTSGTLAGA